MSFIQRSMRFGTVGIISAALYYGLLYAGVEHIGLNAVVVSAMVYPVVLVFNYLMHYRWTFDTSAPHTKALGRYLFMTGCGFFINISTMYLGVSVMHTNYLLVQTVAMAVIVAWNYTLSSLWVFRE